MAATMSVSWDRRVSALGFFVGSAETDLSYFIVSFAFLSTKVPLGFAVAKVDFLNGDFRDRLVGSLLVGSPGSHGVHRSDITSSDTNFGSVAERWRLFLASSV